MTINKSAELFADLAPSLAALSRQRSMKRPVRTSPRCQILLALYDGAAWIGPQLQSFNAQTSDNWELIVSDDGSADHSVEKVWDFVLTTPDRRVRIVEGPGHGHAANFFRLIEAADRNCPYTAFSDQDDVWMTQKLERAISALAAIDGDRPALYASRSVICSEALIPVTDSRQMKRPPSFANALIENICPGHSIVLNNAALKVAQRALASAEGVVAHDWWLYQLITGVGGEIIFDDAPSLYYRQHQSNAIGARTKLPHYLLRLRRLLSGQHKPAIKANLRAMTAIEDMLSAEARAALDAFQKAHEGGFFARMMGFAKSRAHRQTRIESALFWLAVMLKRV